MGGKCGCAPGGIIPWNESFGEFGDCSSGRRRASGPRVSAGEPRHLAAARSHRRSRGRDGRGDDGGRWLGHARHDGGGSARGGPGGGRRGKASKLGRRIGVKSRCTRPLASALHSPLALAPRTRAPPSARPRDARRHQPRDQASSRRRRRPSDGSGTRGHGVTSASVAPRSGPSSQGRRPPGLTVAGAHQSGTLAFGPALGAGRTETTSYNASTTTRSLLSNTSSWAGGPLFYY